MAQFLDAFNYTLGWEDPKREYESITDSNGYATISGINSRWWPHWYTEIASATQIDRASDVQQFYLQEYWKPLGIGCFNSQDLANRVFDECFNSDMRGGVKMLQWCCVHDGQTIAVDGSCGPETCDAVNSLDAEKLLAQYRQARADHYKAIAAHNPALWPELAGWLRRAMA